MVIDVDKSSCTPGRKDILFAIICHYVYLKSDILKVLVVLVLGISEYSGVNTRTGIGQRKVVLNIPKFHDNV